jgi:hypothetical protein
MYINKRRSASGGARAPAAAGGAGFFTFASFSL